MIHIATVHWQDDRWVDIQLDYFRRYLTRPYRVYACLNDLPSDHREKYFYVDSEDIVDHAAKLNILANIIIQNTEDEHDLLIFIDGDAFPIGDILSLVDEKIEAHKILAVQRLENNGDCQPHPSFCATTVGFWREIHGDWKKGFQWHDSYGNLVTDVGGNLLKLLQDKKIDWYPMLRTNKYNPHPLRFGIYHDVVYHHGAGFRPGLDRLTIRKYIHERPHLRLLTRALEKLPRDRFSGVLRRLFHPGKWMPRKMREEAFQLNQRVYEQICQDHQFYQQFMTSGDSTESDHTSDGA